jgi:hypothetical protein
LITIGCVLGNDGNQRYELCTTEPYKGDFVSGIS